jgi:two-component system phosphate regulon response regulator PhoB
VTVGGEEVSLTRLQFKLLVALAERQEHVQSRGLLLAEVWGITGPISTRTVDTHVKRLRDNLRGAGRFIQCVRGVGYRFSATSRGPQAPAWTAVRVHAPDDRIDVKGPESR